MDETSINLVEVRNKKQIAEKAIAVILEEFMRETKAVVETVAVDMRLLKRGGSPLSPATSKPFLIGVSIIARYDL